MPASHPAAAPGGVVTARTVTQQDGDGFIAAQPAAGSGNQPPEYPPQAQQHGEQGDVLLSIHVLANGTADSVSVTQSSGYAVLDQAAATAVWKWRFQPSTLSGQPVPSVIPYRIHFSLQNPP
jgi:protein TonB